MYHIVQFGKKFALNGDQALGPNLSVNYSEKVGLKFYTNAVEWAVNCHHSTSNESYLIFLAYYLQ